MNISEADMSALEAKAQKIGIDDYVERYLHYPPKGPLPIPRNLNKPESVYSCLLYTSDAADE